MQKKTIILIALLFILIAAVGGYFLSKKKFSTKINNEPQKTITELQNQQENSLTVGEPESAQDPIAVTMQTVQDVKSEAVKSGDSSANSIKPTPKVGDRNDSKTISDASAASAGKIVSKLVSFGFQKASGRNIKAIIIHTSYNNLGGDPFDFDKVMQEWKDAGVAPHYAIDRDGTIYQLVTDQNIAWHAGASKLPDGTTDVNGASIGIEIINDQNSKFSDGEYKALNRLIGDLKEKYSIKYVLGHDDIAPGRKTDPWGIEWSKVQK